MVANSITTSKIIFTSKTTKNNIREISISLLQNFHAVRKRVSPISTVIIYYTAYRNPQLRIINTTGYPFINNTFYFVESFIYKNTLIIIYTIEITTVENHNILIYDQDGMRWREIMKFSRSLLHSLLCIPPRISPIDTELTIIAYIILRPSALLQSHSSSFVTALESFIVIRLCFRGRESRKAVFTTKQKIVSIDRAVTFTGTPFSLFYFPCSSNAESYL